MRTFPLFCFFALFVATGVNSAAADGILKDEWSLNAISESVISWIDEQGQYAPVYYIFFLALWVVLLLPCSIIEIVPGFLFGFKTGWLVAVLGKSLGTWISLLIGRYLIKDFLRRNIVDKYPMVMAFNKAIEQEGFKVIIMIRVTYLPMLVKNYGLSVLDIPIWKIVAASLAAGIPFSAMWAAVGVSSKNISEIMSGKLRATDLIEGENTYLFIGGGIVFIVCFLYVFRSFGLRFTQLLKEIDTKEK